MNLSVIIPAYNEEKVIQHTIERVKGYFIERAIDGEIIVVDDGSKDGTRIICEKEGVILNKKRKNRGKGYAVKEGFFMAKKDLVLFMDADGSTDITMADRFFPLLESADILIGSRELPESKIVVYQPPHRIIAGKTFKLAVRLLTLPTIRDSQCGFKLFKRERCKKLFVLQTLEGFAFDVELLYLARKYKRKIKEIPIVWKNDEDSRVKLIRDAYRMFRDIIYIKWKNLCGGYK